MKAEISTKIIALFFCFLTFILVFLTDSNKNNNFFSKKEKKSYVAGVPVYDLPQI
jgi:YbbR domain-containing protein